MILQPLTSVLFSHCDPEELLLQTLIVRLKQKSKIREARVLIDRGSKKSYIPENTAENLALSPTEKINFIHSIFDGFNSEEKNHNLFTVKLEALSGKYSSNIELLDHGTVCSKISRLKEGSLNKELQEANYRLGIMEQLVKKNWLLFN